MLKPHDVFARMSPAVGESLFSFLMEKEHALYKTTIDTLAKQRKLRTIFVDRKPRLERNAWLKEVVGKKVNEPIAAHLLQIWLVGAHANILCDFLDALGIAHDENGTIENLPPSPSKDDLIKAVNALLEKHDPAVVVVYLNAFQALDDEGWKSLAELLDEDARLRF